MPENPKKLEVVYVNPRELKLEKKHQQPRLEKPATELDPATLAAAWGLKAS